MVGEDWINQNYPAMDAPWQPGLLNHDSEKDDGIWLFSGKKRHANALHFQVYNCPRLLTLGRCANTWQRILLRNPFVPLLIRLTVLTFVLAALALGASIYNESNGLNNIPVTRQGVVIPNEISICRQESSTYMAFIVCSFAVIYLLYITWDEYFSKPLGLRSSRAKMRLLFLDLLFIVFSAANLSLAFYTVTDQQWSCFAKTTNFQNNNAGTEALSTCAKSTSLCSRQKALSSVLLIVLIAWLLTFTISVMR